MILYVKLDSKTLQSLQKASFAFRKAPDKDLVDLKFALIVTKPFNRLLREILSITPFVNTIYYTVSLFLLEEVAVI